MAEIRIADKDTLDRIARAVGIKDDNRIYGIKIDKYDSNPDTRCTYLGDAIGMTPAKMNFETGEFDYGDWADAWFVRDNFPCMLKSNGAIDYRLDPNHYGKKEDGTPSDASNMEYDGNAMSAIPTVWIWQYELGDFKYIWLANYKVNDNYKAYAHQRPDGSIAPYVFMSIYKGSLGSTTGTKLFSLSGFKPAYTYTRAEEDTFISNWLDTSIWRRKTWLQRNLMQCLITMIICSTDASSKLGYGSYESHHTTGITDLKGQFYGSLGDEPMKAFHQEDIWCNSWETLDGFSLQDGIITIEDKYMLSIPRDHGSSGCFSNSVMTEFGDFPIETNGSFSTYECAMVLLCSINDTKRAINVGMGAPDPDTGRKCNNLYAYNDTYNFNSSIGTEISLSCLP